MTRKSVITLAVLVIGGYTGYRLWNHYGSRRRARLENEDRDGAAPALRRISERSELTVAELAVGSDDPVAQATAILTESDERSRLPRTADGVERRRSEDTVEP